jgi:flagellar operon protein (TIGR03826 family)
VNIFGGEKSMGELMNCPKCNALFVKSLHSVCEKCRKEEELQFDKVYTFLRKKENRSATITEIAEGTGVNEDLIMKFVKEGRLRTAMFPNLGYPCDRCGTQIQQGKLCLACLDNLQQGLNIHELEKQKAEEKNAYFLSSKNRK